MPSLKQFLFGRNEKNKQKPYLTPEQQEIERNLEAATQGRGAQGSFGESADYYRDILSQDPNVMQQLDVPEMDRFYNETVPGLSEQYGGLGGNSFQDGASHAGKSLSERLRAMRAGLRENAAAGLSSMGQFALQPRVENIHRPETSGFVGSIAKGLGMGVGSGIGTISGQQNPKGFNQSYNNQAQVGQDIYKQSTSGLAPTSAIGNPVAWRK